MTVIGLRQAMDDEQLFVGAQSSDGVMTSIQLLGATNGVMDVWANRMQSRSEDARRFASGLLSVISYITQKRLYGLVAP